MHRRIMIFSIAIAWALMACDSGGEVQLDQLLCDSPVYDANLNGFRQIRDPETGSLMAEGHLEEGIPQGFWKFFSPNGQILKEGNFTKGQPDGFWKFYRDDGQIWQEGHIRECQRVGFWKVFDCEPPHTLVFEGQIP